MGRRIEHRRIFRTIPDLTGFAEPLGEVAASRLIAVSAWVLLPSHMHRLVRTGSAPRVHAMRALLTGCAGATADMLTAE